jgi:hypothetical protein
MTNIRLIFINSSLLTAKKLSRLHLYYLAVEKYAIPSINNK